SPFDFTVTDESPEPTEEPTPPDPGDNPGDGGGTEPPLPPAPGTVDGTVTAADDGAPIAGVTVTLQPGSHSAITDGTGDYTITDVPPATYTATATASGWEPGGRTDVVVTSGTTTQVDFALQAIPTEYDNTVAVPLHWQTQY